MRRRAIPFATAAILSVLSVSTARLQQLADLMLEFRELKSSFNAAVLVRTP